jgi:HAD superfamily hydrolase (TIGR01509 family)
LEALYGWHFSLNKAFIEDLIGGKMENKLSAVIFDMDGLMFDTERLALEAWKEVGKSAGFNMTDEIILASVGMNERDTEKIMKLHYGEDFHFAELRRQTVQYIKDYVKSNGMPVKAGLYEILDFLNAKGIKTAVATSTERIRAEEHINSCNILDRFNTIVCGDEVDRGKPEPDIFLLAAKKLECKPEECIVLEDSENGVKAAYKAGMKPIMIPDLIIPKDEIKILTHKVLDSLNHVIVYIESAL